MQSIINELKSEAPKKQWKSGFKKNFKPRFQGHKRKFHDNTDEASKSKKNFKPRFHGKKRKWNDGEEKARKDKKQRINSNDEKEPKQAEEDSSFKEDNFQNEAHSSEETKKEENSFLSDQDFDSLDLSQEMAEAVKELGFSKMTQVQSKTFPLILNKKDVAAAAKTGSGKTLAFLVPTIERLVKEGFRADHGTGVLIISPTRELALQTFDVLQKLLKHFPSYSFGLLIGGIKRHLEIKMLRKGINFLVGTPGRLLDHMKSSILKCTALHTLIIDEADKLLDIGFKEDVTQIIKMLPSERQTLLFSATLSQKMDELLQLALKKNHATVGIEHKFGVAATVEGLKQVYVLIPLKLRLVFLINLLKRQLETSKFMVFFSTSDSVIFHHKLLEGVGIPNLCIHGKQKQKKRTLIFYEFNQMEKGVLLCTDVAARGLDIPKVDCILQYDPPLSTKEYIHRVGRTARGASATGNAILFLRNEEYRFITHLKNDAVPITELEVDWGKIKNVQAKLEELVNNDTELKEAARTAHLNFIYSYACHKLKDCFSHKTLKHDEVATNFCLKEVPEFKPLKKRMTSTTIKDKARKPSFKVGKSDAQPERAFNKPEFIYYTKDVRKKMKKMAEAKKRSQTNES